MKAKIRRLLPDIELPSYKTVEAAGFDIAAAETKVIPAGAVALIRTGLVIECPEGHWMAIASRGSLAVKKGLMVSNGIGVLDRDYAGPNDEVLIQVFNFGKEDITVEKGERLVQGIFLPVEQVEWIEADSDIRSVDRGGHGSTGGYSA